MIIKAMLCCDENSSDSYPLYVHLTASMIPILVLWFHYHDVISYWWMGDDPIILWDMIDKGIFSHFYKPDIWRSFSAPNLFPWIHLSFGLDWHLFGMQPSGFYWHQIISFTIVLLIAYGVLRLYFHPALVSFVLVLFTLSVPSATVIQSLMDRHYLEGFGMALSAYYCYVIADHSDKYRWSFVGAFFYLLSVTAKEIYVPLVVILSVLSVNSGQKKLKILIPYIIVAGIYVLWRVYMLGFGSTLSGYQYPGWNDLVMFFPHAAAIIGLNYFWQKAVILIGCLCIFAITDKRSSYTSLSILGTWFVIVLAPIASVICVLDARYLFLPCFLLFVLIGNNIKKLWSINKYRVISCALAISLIVTLSISVFQNADLGYIKEMQERYRKEGEFVFYGSDDQTTLINPIGPAWYYLGLKWLRQYGLKKSSGPSLCYNPYFCELLDHNKGYQYINHALIKVDWPAVESDFKWVDNTANLSLNISYNSYLGKLNWNFGPYTDGVYKLVICDKQNKIFGYSIQLPKENTLSYRLQTPLNFVLEYTAPEGWKTFSPAMALNPNLAKNSSVVQIQWKRNQSS
jgi:hypothetical protein